MVSGEKNVTIKITETDDWCYGNLLMNKEGILSPIPIHTYPTEWIHNNYTVQELILVSHDKIKVDDWYIDDSGRIRQSVTGDEDYWSRRPEYKKIVAINRDLSVNGVKIPRFDFQTFLYIINILNTNKVPIVSINYTQDNEGNVSYERDGSYIVINKK